MLNRESLSANFNKELKKQFDISSIISDAHILFIRT